MYAREHFVNVFERRTLLGFMSPAVQHHVVYVIGARPWLIGEHPLASFYGIVDDLLVGHGIERLLTAKRENLPHENPEGPYVGLFGEPSIKTLICHPTYGKDRTALDAIVEIRVEVLTHAKVGNFNFKVLAHKYIPGC